MGRAMLGYKPSACAQFVQLVQQLVQGLDEQLVQVVHIHSPSMKDSVKILNASFYLRIFTKTIDFTRTLGRCARRIT